MTRDRDVYRLDLYERKHKSDKVHMCEYLDTKNEQFMKKKNSLYENTRTDLRILDSHYNGILAVGRGQKYGIRGNYETNQLYQVFWDLITGRFRPYVFWSGIFL